jgi:TRAP-type C4-dicarboxylate transport system permease small subunit
MKFFKKLITCFDITTSVGAFLAGALLVLVMIFVTVGVLLRYVLNRPIGWAVEVCEYSLVCITFLVAAWVLRKEGHVRVDLVLSLLRPKTQLFLNTITSALSTGVCLVLTFFGGRVTRELFRGNYFTPTILMIPKFIFIGFIAFGCLLLSIQFIRRTYKLLQSWKA